MTVVSVNNLSKVYGAITALKGVTLDVKPGEIYGLLGQNGAGKSTLIKILLGIISKTSGEATLLDAPAGDIATRRRVGYLPEDHRFPYYHTAESLLDVYGRLYGLSRSTRLARIEESLRIVGLAKRKQYKIKTFSKGMKQRLGIAQAIFHDPEVVFLDEPTDGIDPVGRKEIRDLLLKLKEDGRTIFFNSHLLNEVEMIADRVAILDKGSLLKEGKVADLTRQVDRFEIGIASGDEFPWKELQRRGYPTTHSGNRYDVELPEGKSLDEVLTVLQAANVRLRHLVEKKLTLEEVFVSLVKSDKVDRERAIRELKGES